MVAILENPEVRPHVRKISVRAFEQLDDPDDTTRTELVRGVIIERMPPSPEHDFLIEQLGGALRTAAGAGSYCRQEQGMKLADSVLVPDLTIVAGSSRDYRHTYPTTALLVVEIAITTLGLDREKAALYAEAGVAEYWLVAVGNETVEVYTRPLGDQYAQRRVYTSGETILSVALSNLQVEVGSLFSD